MDDDDLPRPGDPLDAVRRTDLDPFSVHELEARIRMLEAEVARTRAKLDGAKSFRAGADALFKS